MRGLRIDQMGDKPRQGNGSQRRQRGLKRFRGLYDIQIDQGGRFLAVEPAQGDTAFFLPWAGDNSDRGCKAKVHLAVKPIAAALDMQGNRPQRPGLRPGLRLCLEPLGKSRTVNARCQRCNRSLSLCGKGRVMRRPALHSRSGRADPQGGA